MTERWPLERMRHPSSSVVGAPSRLANRAGLDPWLLGALGVSAVLNCWHLTWGLPNGNQSWAADAIGPVTALGIARRTFAGWNSGWFYFKYPPGWPFLMVVAFMPYLAYLYATAGWRHPTSAYPFGFADPERSLFVLALIGRLLAVAFGVGLVALSYAIADRLFDRSTARWSASLTATAYPLIYYAHTTNLDISYCFWLILALYAAIIAADMNGDAVPRPRPRHVTELAPWAVLGITAAMALSTKEQGFAFLLPLPILALAARVRRQGSVRALWQAPTWVMCGAGLVTLLVASNAVVNPLGFVGRIAYLLGHPLQPVEARLAPVEFAFWKGAKEWRYLDQLWIGLDSSLGWPVLALAGIGALAAWRRPRAAVWLLVPTLALYYLSLRGLELITVRYLLPVTVVALILVAALLVWLRDRAPAGPPRWAAAGLLAGVAAYGLARATELEWLLTTDSRYGAEAWMAEHLPPGAHVEIYQKPAFLPRFHGVSATYVPIGGRSRDGLSARQPDAIVTSSASHKSITHRWTPDWRTTGEMLQAEPAAVDVLRAVEGGDTAYRVGAVFGQQPRLIHNRITSLAPEIVIYVRQP